MKSASEDIESATQARKRKRSVPTKLKVSTITDQIPLKRPRGRPPLNPLSNTFSSANFPAPIRVPTKSHIRRPDVPPSLPIISVTSEVHTKTLKSLLDSPGPEAEVAKIVRPHSALVTQRILSRLMTEGPLSVADLVVAGIDAPPRDLVQSILDVLQVTAVVVQLKPLKDPKAAHSFSSSSSGANAGGGVVNSNNSVLYAMAGIAKGSEYTELSKLTEVTANKLLKASATRKRIERLQVNLHMRFDADLMDMMRITIHITIITIFGKFITVIIQKLMTIMSNVTSIVSTSFPNHLSCHCWNSFFFF